MEQFFKIKERGSSVGLEIIAGVTTFFAMSYILMVNSGMFTALQEPYGVTFGAIYIATAVSAAVGTVAIGLLANLPLAQASGMGLNAFFVFTVCFGLGFTYENALVFVLFDGILFIILTVTKLRRLIFEAIPEPVKRAIPIGIGLFIMLLGFRDSGIVINSESTGLDLASFNIIGGNTTWESVMPMFITILTLIIMIVLSTTKKLKSAGVLIAIVIGTVLYYLLGAINGTMPAIDMVSPGEAMRDFGNIALGAVFRGFDFSFYLQTHSVASLIAALITTSLAFCLVDMFDTSGTLFGACKSGDMLDEDGNVPNMDRAMLADAIATTVGSVCGTSTVTTYVESSAGVAAGGRTGLSAIVTAILFLVAIPLSPVASIVPSAAYAPALIYVGFLMFKGVKDLDWSDVAGAAAGVVTLAAMPFTYNISYGICFGLITFVGTKSLSGHIKEIKPATWVITILFVIMLLTAR